MMKKSSIRKVLSLIGCMVLIAAMALSFTGCSTGKPNETPAETGESVTFQFVESRCESEEGLVEIELAVVIEFMSRCPCGHDWLRRFLP